MTIKTITFQQTFPTGSFQNQKIGIEIDVSDENSQSDFIRIYQYAKDTVNQAFHAMNPGAAISVNPEFAHHLQQSIPVINKERDRVEIMIDDATDLADLHALWEKACEHHLNDHYEKRLKELS